VYVSHPFCTAKTCLAAANWAISRTAYLWPWKPRVRRMYVELGKKLHSMSASLCRELPMEVVIRILGSTIRASASGKSCGNFFFRNSGDRFMFVAVVDAALGLGARCLRLDEASESSSSDSSLLSNIESASSSIASSSSSPVAASWSLFLSFASTPSSSPPSSASRSCSSVFCLFASLSTSIAQPSASSSSPSPTGSSHTRLASMV
jgi:hypothetical protein